MRPDMNRMRIDVPSSTALSSLLTADDSPVIFSPALSLPVHFRWTVRMNLRQHQAGRVLPVFPRDRHGPRKPSEPWSCEPRKAVDRIRNTS